MRVNVKDVMIPDARACRPDQNLAEIAEIMWNARCGALPILDTLGHVTGMITDRDICIALGTRNQRASDIHVSDVAAPRYFACAAEDDIHAALKTMAAQEVRRLPVVDKNGNLVGILSIDDVILHAKARSQMNYTEVMATLKAICGHREAEHVALATTA